MVEPPTRRRTRLAPEVRREEILDAASRVISAKGLSATVSDVAAEAGIAKGTVYLYFVSKEELLSGLAVRYSEDLVRRSEVLLEGASGGMIDRADRFLEAMIDFHLAGHDLHHVMFHDAGIGGTETARRMRGVIERFIEAGVEAGEFEVEDAGFTADFLLHGLNGAMLTVLHQAEPDRGRFLVPARRLVRGALGVVGEAGRWP